MGFNIRLQEIAVANIDFTSIRLPCVNTKQIYNFDLRSEFFACLKLLHTEK